MSGWRSKSLKPTQPRFSIIMKLTHLSYVDISMTTTKPTKTKGATKPTKAKDTGKYAFRRITCLAIYHLLSQQRRNLVQKIPKMPKPRQPKKQPFAAQIHIPLARDTTLFLSAAPRHSGSRAIPNTLGNRSLTHLEWISSGQSFRKFL
jgi:hypothetical protein